MDMKTTLKPVASETALPVQAGPGATPDEDVSSEEGDFAGVRARLAEVLSVVRAKATVAVEFAQVKVSEARSMAGDVAVSARASAISYAKAGQEKVYIAADYAKETALGATSGVRARLSKAIDGVGETRTSATKYVLSLKATAFARAQGVTSWARGLAGDTITRAKALTESARSRTMKAYDEAWTLALNTLQGGRARAIGSAKFLQEKAAERTSETRRACAATYNRASEKAIEATRLAKEKAVEVGSAAREAAADPKVQCTAASAAGGAAAMGATGAATGLAAGSTIGAAIGVVPALFTFGLSIPIGAAIGGGAGLAVGTAVGSTVGAVSGGAAGYKVYSNKDDLRSGAAATMSKVGDFSDYVKGGVSASADYAQETASKLRARLVGSRK